MTYQELSAVINDTLVELFELERGQLKPDADLRKDLGLDSIDSADLIISLEKRFAIRIDEAQAKQLVNLEEICDYVASKAGIRKE